MKYEDFLNELVILEKKYLLYSHGHDFVNQAVLDLLRTIGELHSNSPKIKVVDTGYNLVINDAEFNADNIKVGYLMQLLGSRGIISVTFCTGVGFSSIMDFLYLLNAIPNSSKLLYHPDIQLAIHSIDSIEVEEMDYGSLRYGYESETQDPSSDDDQIRTKLYESLKSLNPDIEGCDTNELIDIALEELSKMPQTEVPNFLQGLSYDVVSEMIARANAKQNSISPSLIDLLVAMDSARKYGSKDTSEESVDEISSDLITKLVEREAYELYVSDDYRHHLRSLLAYDIQSEENISEIDVFDKTLVNRTIVTALIHLTRNKLDNIMHTSFVDSIYQYLDEFIDCQDWPFIHSISGDDLVSSYLDQDSTVLRLSEAIRGNKSYRANHLKEVIQASGSKNLFWLIDSYIDESDIRTRRDILLLIQPFQENAAIQAVKRYIEDPTRKMSLFMPIVKDHLSSISKDLTMKLFTCDSADAKLLAMRIQLTQDDDSVKNQIERFIRDGDNDLILGLLDLIREFRITEVISALVDRISTFYIDDSMYQYIVKTIDTIAWIDSSAYKDLDKRLTSKMLTLSPKKLRRVKNHLKGVSHDYKSS